MTISHAGPGRPKRRRFPPPFDDNDAGGDDYDYDGAAGDEGTASSSVGVPTTTVRGAEVVTEAAVAADDDGGGGRRRHREQWKPQLEDGDDGDDADADTVESKNNRGNPPADVDADAVAPTELSASPSPPPSSSPPPPPTPPALPPPPTPYDTIKRAIVTNDGERQSLIRLVGLKSLFARQLPKMPKEYIARLVFDRRHSSLALLSTDRDKVDCDEGIIGGICYRAYPEMRFAEIAFCAVSASQQVKGYGTKLMNLFKMHAVTIGIEHFITYADNYAIGYFKKQGFTKAVQMPKGRYQGLIKDYDGGTIMECYVHPSIDFTRIPETVAAQKKFIEDRIRAGTSKSDKVVYPPLPPDFATNSETATSRGAVGDARRALSIPGVIEAGWTMADLVSVARGIKDSDQKRHVLKSELMALVNKVSDQQFAWCFRDPVNIEEVKDYMDVISDPIDLRTMEKRIRKGDWYKNKLMLYSDMMKMANNCKVYNGEGSTYYDLAVSMEKYLGTIFPKSVTHSLPSANEALK